MAATRVPAMTGRFGRSRLGALPPRLPLIAEPLRLTAASAHRAAWSAARRRKFRTPVICITYRYGALRHVSRNGFDVNRWGTSPPPSELALLIRLACGDQSQQQGSAAERFEIILSGRPRAHAAVNAMGSPRRSCRVFWHDVPPAPAGPPRGTGQRPSPLRGTCRSGSCRSGSCRSGSCRRGGKATRSARHASCRGSARGGPNNSQRHDPDRGGRNGQQDFDRGGH